METIHSMIVENNRLILASLYGTVSITKEDVFTSGSMHDLRPKLEPALLNQPEARLEQPEDADPTDNLLVVSYRVRQEPLQRVIIGKVHPLLNGQAPQRWVAEFNRRFSS